MFIKLDMAKAYDRVEWIFLQNILVAFGFCHQWVDWIMSCVTSTSFFVLMNGIPLESFSASRGLRQGDPIFPYLFIILAKGFGHFLKFCVHQGLIHGWKLSDGLPPLSHLQFVDDTSFMGQSCLQEATPFRYALDVYLAALSQKVNEKKSSIFFLQYP